ncbi:MAG TPA: BatD family protein, partial [Longimicrobiales bacterium]|nr:BatD family protein [Longimicrobiales bacterium]
MRGNALGAAIRNGACAVPIVLSALLLAAGTARSQGPLRVSAYLSADTVPAGDIVVLQIVAETDGPAPDIVDPRLPAGLDIVGRSDRTEIQFSFPANRIRTLRRELAIRASAPGEYRIPPVRVTAGNAERETAAVTLFVSGPVATAAASGIDGIVLQAALSADTVFVSEQVTLRTDVLVADDARSRLRGSPEYTPPDASGFWLHEVPRDPPRILIRDGRRFEVQSFARAYFPITPGEYTIPPARLVYETRDAFMAASARHELTTDTFRVVVLPVPDEGRPEGFTGAVGRFEIGAAVEPTDVVAGDPVALTITVAGTGNLRGLPPPELPALRGTEVYPPTEETSVDFIDGAVRGTKRFTWIVVPEIAGPLQVPPVEYHYFDPETRTFEVARSEPLAITVRGSPGRVASLDSGVRPARRIRSSEPPLHWVRSPAFA